jgi:hypothetical protein
VLEGFEEPKRLTGDLDDGGRLVPAERTKHRGPGPNAVVGGRRGVPLGPRHVRRPAAPVVSDPPFG